MRWRLQARAMVGLLGVVTLVTVMSPSTGLGCTNILVSKGASTDGSVIITYACDGEFHPHLEVVPASDHEPGAEVELRHWDGTLVGTIPQVEHTYAVVGLMNEHQVAIGETTFDGREELQNPDGLLHYWRLMRLALQRAATAREAVEVITSLVAEHGYRSTGESFSIADPDEAWILEMIGPGPGGDGAHWVALKVPDGSISAHANRSRIGEFPLDDPESCLYSPDVIELAVEKGYWDPESGEPFRFNAAYDPDTPQKLRYTATRVWSIFRRAAPSLDLSPDFHRGVQGAEEYPLWIEPDEKLSVADVMALMRDHYEGTPYDMTKGVDAGPFGSPDRWRPMTWEVDGEEYTWERPIATQQTGFSFVSQSRDWLPDGVGGLWWYGVDDIDTTVYIPLYCSMTEAPPAYTTGRLSDFSWDSAWWVFNFVATVTHSRYRDMIEDVRAVQQDLEGHFLALQPAVERTAAELADSDPELMHRYLTDYAVQHAEQVVVRWKRLGEQLLRRYNDGYYQAEPGRPTEVGYPQEWLEIVVRERGDQLRLPKWEEEATDTELPY